jgi:hypothetical protein
MRKKNIFLRVQRMIPLLILLCLFVWACVRRKVILSILLCLLIWAYLVDNVVLFLGFIIITGHYFEHIRAPSLAQMHGLIIEDAEKMKS